MDPRLVIEESEGRIMSPSVRTYVLVLLAVLAFITYAVFLHCLGMNETYCAPFAISTAVALWLAYSPGQHRAKRRSHDPSLDAQIKDWARDKHIYVHSGHKTTTCGNTVFLGNGFPLGSPEKAPDILLEGYWPDLSLNEKKDIILRLWQDSGAMISILKSLQEKHPVSPKNTDKPVAESEIKYSFVASTEEWLSDFTVLMPLKLVRAIEEWVRNHPLEGEDLLDAVRSFLHTPDDALLPYWAPLSYATKSAIWEEWLDDPAKTGDILTKLKTGGYPI